jgi:hypothetical protein
MWKQFFSETHLRIRWLFTILTALYILSFFIFLEPLKGNIVSYDYPFAYNILAFLGIWGMNILTCIVLPYLFPKYFKAKSWTLTRFFAWFLVFCMLIIVVSYFFDVSVQPVENVDEWTNLYFKGYIPPVSIFLASSVLAFFFLYNPKPSVVSELPQTFNPINEIPSSTEAPAPLSIHFYDTNGKKALELNLDCLYYISSANNYIEVFYKKETASPDKATISRILLRNTLKTIEEQNAHLPELYRCHKTFIVNAQQVVAVKGNSKGYTLVLQEIPNEIPVSRHKNSDLETRFPSLL